MCSTCLLPLSVWPTPLGEDSSASSSWLYKALAKKKKKIRFLLPYINKQALTLFI